MVSVNFHQLRKDIRQTLLVRADQLAADWDPFVAAWLGYALSTDGIENNQPLRNLLYTMRRWLQEDAWSYQRYLGPVALCLWLLKKTGDFSQSEFVGEFVKRVVALNADEKFSVFRDPEQVFLLALGVAAIGDESAKERIVSISNYQMGLRPLRGRILYGAALRELSQEVTFPDQEPVDEGDIIALAWWAEKYQGERRKAWERFSSVAEKIALDAGNASDSQRLLSVPEVAMFYEAVSKETMYPEPALLFDYFPFYLRLRESARDHFMAGKYVAAVLEATKGFNEMIQKKSGVKDKNESELVQATMKQISEPSKLKIRFNKFLHEDAGKNEQSGLALIAEGVFKAFRNPKGHKPESHDLVQMDAYEALHQLIIIDYLMVRIEKSNE